MLNIQNIGKDMPLKVFCNNTFSGRLSENDMGNAYFKYDSKNSPIISLTMPIQEEGYYYNQNPHPIFDMFIPEGFLLELFKEQVKKRGRGADAFSILEYFGANIKSRITLEKPSTSDEVVAPFLDDILKQNTQSVFEELLKSFLKQSAISGIQPKVVANLKEKKIVQSREYIVKTSGSEFPFLSINEYLCMGIAENAGVSTPVNYLSDDGALFVIEKFDFDKKVERFIGFEEACSLQGKLKDDKYSGTYRDLYKTLMDFSSPAYKLETKESFFRQLVLVNMLRNGDAHLKNFGIVFDPDDINNSRKISPAYDIVCTTPYLRGDTLALFSPISKNKHWMCRDEIVSFGADICALSRRKIISIIEQCESAVNEGVLEVEHMIDKYREFQSIGERMILSFCPKLDRKNGMEI